MAHLAGGEVEVHGDGVGGVHEDVGHAHQVFDGLQLQAQEVPVEGLPTDGLQEGELSGTGASGPRGTAALLRSPWQQCLFHSLAPQTRETRAAKQKSPHFTDGETEAQGPTQGGRKVQPKSTGLQLGSLASSWQGPWQVTYILEPQCLHL